MSTEKSTAVAKKETEITTVVLNKINTFQKSGELRLPKDYSPENALKSAYLVLNEMQTKDKKPVLDVCSKPSIANALLKMVVWGVSPLKGQIYFVPYADKLEASISYLGNIMMAKRYGNLKSIKANCIMDGDDFEFEIDPTTGLRRIVKHKQTLQSIGSEKIIGAYAAFELNDGTKDVEIMNMDQIKKSWNQGATNGGSPAHKNFPDQMSQRTVLNRACKLLIRASDDKVLYDDVDNEIDVAKEDVAYEIENNANTSVIDIDHQEEEDKTETLPDGSSANVKTGEVTEKSSAGQKPLF
jgi:recombination protein RecT